MGISGVANEIGGRHLIDSTGFSANDVECSDTQTGVFLAQVSQAEFRETTPTNNIWGGTVLGGSDVTLEGVTIWANDYGFDLAEVTAITVTESSIGENGYGLWVANQGGDPSTLEVRSNDLVDNRDFGLSLETAGAEEAHHPLLREAVGNRLTGAPPGVVPTLTATLLADYDQRREINMPAQTTAVLPATGNWWGIQRGRAVPGRGTATPFTVMSTSSRGRLNPARTGTLLVEPE